MCKEEKTKAAPGAATLAAAARAMCEQARALLARVRKNPAAAVDALDAYDNGALESIHRFFAALALPAAAPLPADRADALVVENDALLAAMFAAYPRHRAAVLRARHAFHAARLHWREPAADRADFKRRCDEAERRVCAALSDLAMELRSDPDPCAEAPRAGNDAPKGKAATAKHARTRKFSDAEEREIVAFVERPDFDTGRERNGVTCRNVAAAARSWARLKHAKRLPQTPQAFQRAYRSAKDRKRRSNGGR